MEIPKVDLDDKIVKKLDVTGEILDIFCYNMPNLIKALCDKSLDMFTELKVLTEYYLKFLDEKELMHTEIAQKTLAVYKKFFLKT